MARSTRTGGREATQGVIPGRVAISVGRPDLDTPEGFSWIALSDVARLESGHTPSRRIDEYWNGDVPWIGIRDATGNHGRTIFDTEQHVTQAGLDNSSARLLPAGTVCLSRTASVGYVVSMGVPMATSQDFVNWVCGRELNPKYLHYALVLEQESIRRFSHGSTHKTMYYPEAKALHLLAPKRSRQDAIVEVLGALDDKISANTRLASTAHELAEALYSRAMDGLPKIRMSEHLESVLGGTPKRSEDRYWNGDIPWASAKDVASAELGVLLGTSESITPDAIRETKVKPLPAGSVVLTARGTVGAVARLGVPAAVNQSCYGFAPDVLPKSVLYFAMRSIAEQTRSLAHGSVFDTITRRTFDFVEVPDGESSEIATLEGKLAEVLELSESRMRENASLASTRDALLSLLMSGKVTVKDAETVVEGVA